MSQAIKEGASYLVSSCNACPFEDYEEVTRLVTPGMARMLLNRRFIEHVALMHPIAHRPLPPPHPSDIARALENTRSVERADEQKPKWDDFVAEGVIDHVPEPGPDGVLEAVAVGPEKAAKALAMTVPAALVEAERAETLLGAEPRVEMKLPSGQVKRVLEKNEDTVGRRRGGRKQRRTKLT